MSRSTVFLCLLTISFAGPIQARVSPAVSGVVRGTVKDSTGAVIPGAMVTAIDRKGGPHSAETKADGSYRINGLEDGTYTIEAHYTGLRQTKSILVEVKAGRMAEADISLTVRSQMQEITVNESGPGQVSTEAANNASALVLRQEDLDSLPDDPDDLQADLQAL